MSASTGIVLTTDPEVDLDQLMSDADLAMYAAKQGGGARPLRRHRCSRARGDRLSVALPLVNCSKWSTHRRPEAVRFDEHGLVPCVMQDWRTGEVLTLAYMNDEALERTRETGEVHFYSRSRGEIWHKGQTSGNVQRVRQIRYDCDADALVALVDPAGPACHTGQRSCFYRDLEGSADPAPDAPPADGEPAPAAYEALAALERTLLDRRQRRPDGSYTVELLDDPPRIADKVREEADEVSRAAGSESEERVAEEAADVLYHLHVLLVSRGISIASVLETLNGRRR